MQWFIDFDDTLAVGPITWAFEHVIPQMIEKNHLTYDEAVYNEAVLTAQRQGNDNVDEKTVIDDFFTTIGWPHHLKDQFLRDIYEGYTPTLFDDSTAFMDRLTADRHKIFIISNNNHAPFLAQQLGIEHYFTAIFTPKACGGVRGKPQRDMWDFVMAQSVVDSSAPVVIVGDDPWSDGDFAQNCNTPCWILDRMSRFSSLHTSKPFRWAKSLNDITY